MMTALRRARLYLQYYISEIGSAKLAEDTLGALEFQIIAVLLEHPREAYGISIMQRLEDRTGKRRSLAAIYATLDRLQQKRLISSWWGEPTEERGGRRKRYYQVEAPGEEAARRTVLAFQAPLAAGASA